MNKKTLIGGGKLYYSAVGADDKDYKEWGLVESAKLSLKQESKEIFGWSESGYKEVIEEIIISKDYTLSFESKNLSNDVLKIAFNAKESEENGKVKLELGTTESKTYQFKFVGTGNNKLTVIFHKVMLKSDIDLSLIDDDFKSISFEGKCQSNGKDVVTILTEKEKEAAKKKAEEEAAKNKEINK